MKYLTVKITKEDIEQGQKPWWEMGGFSYSRAESCPIATALKRMGYKQVDIIGTYGRVDQKHVYLGRTAQKFLSEADLHFRSIRGNSPDGPPIIRDVVEPPKPTTLRLQVEDADGV